MLLYIIQLDSSEILHERVILLTLIVTLFCFVGLAKIRINLETNKKKKENLQDSYSDIYFCNFSARWRSVSFVS